MGKTAKGGGGRAAAGPLDKGKVADLLKQLSPMQGKALISIAVPAGDDLSRTSDWLESEQSLASALKSRETKIPLLEALASVREQLKSYSQAPATGLVVFCGEALDGGGGRSQKVAMGFVPFRPLTTSLRVRDTNFDVAALRELLGSDGAGGRSGVLPRFMEEATRSTGMACYGARDTIEALEAAAVTTLIVWERLELRRVRARGKASGEEQDLYVTPAEDRAGKFLKCPKTGERLERVETAPFVGWIRENSWVFGVEVEVVTDASEQGGQFCRGFGGIGALLRYNMFFEALDDGDAEFEVGSGEAASGGPGATYDVEEAPPELLRGWEALLAAAPQVGAGKPSAEDIGSLKAHAQEKKVFLSGLPPGQAQWLRQRAKGKKSEA